MTFSADSHSFEVSPRGAPGDRLSGRVALFSVIDARAKYRCTCTTHLTHGRSRSPLRRYGRHENAATRLTPLQQLCCCRLLFKLDGFTGSSCPPRLSYREVPVETIAAPFCEENPLLSLSLYPTAAELSRANGVAFSIFFGFLDGLFGAAREGASRGTSRCASLAVPVRCESPRSVCRRGKVRKSAPSAARYSP